MGIREASQQTRDDAQQLHALLAGLYPVPSVALITVGAALQGIAVDNAALNGLESSTEAYRNWAMEIAPHADALMQLLQERLDDHCQQLYALGCMLCGLGYNIEQG